jgi:type II secretory pathway component PulF
MPAFAYKALDRQGKESNGTLSADNRAAAVEQVIQRGFTPIDVHEHRQETGEAVPKAAASTQRVPKAQVENFTREMANLLSAAVPLSRALTIVIREASHPAARAQWTAIHDSVVGGQSLADSLARFPNTFPSVYVAMVRAGETGGFLDVVLSQISDFQTREKDLVGKVKAAMVYPAVLATLAVAVLIFLLTYFIPRFTIIFNDFGGNLPVLTRAIIVASDMLMKRGPVVVVAAIVIFVVIRRIAETESGRRSIDRVLLSLPMVGNIVARFALIRFLRMLGTLLGAGVGLIAALRVAKEAIGNQILTDIVTNSIEQVQQGASLAKSLSGSHKLFPPSVSEMIAVAEETGRLDKELQRMSIALESDLDRRLRILVALAEPLLLFLMASVIGTIVVGMLLPLFQLQDLVH